MPAKLFVVPLSNIKCILCGQVSVTLTSGEWRMGHSDPWLVTGPCADLSLASHDPRSVLPTDTIQMGEWCEWHVTINCWSVMWSVTPSHLCRVTPASGQCSHDHSWPLRSLTHSSHDSRVKIEPQRNGIEDNWGHRHGIVIFAAIVTEVLVCDTWLYIKNFLFLF